MVECWLQETHVHCGSFVHPFMRMKNTSHIDINRRFLCFYCCILASSDHTRLHTHTHTLHKTSFNGASHRVVFHYFHLHTSTEQQSIEEYRESSMKQTTIYLLIHLKWLNRSFMFTLSMKWNEMNKTIIFRWTKWIKYTFDESILCVQPNWFINAFINGNK